ncbi:MAG: indolepyruvate ferredoxin oxidoreductase family protein [Chloroflexi bacterium]|nr:indolepyruvate ferredoxin oxidoreductase family protein [Chloroflexota bacterium]
MARKDQPGRFSLDAKYLQLEGRIVLNGTQALARLLLDQHRADRRQGWNTASFVTGYRGSPMGSLDMTLERHLPLFRQHQVHFMPAVNEELAATALMGSQQANLLEGARYDGVVGMWYGKGPGVDRSGDAFRHANYCGVGERGGVLVLAGDDPACKSSTIPSSSEVALYDACMPILFPGNVQELLDYGRYGYALSRYCGSWVGMKIVTNVADAFETATVSEARHDFQMPAHQVAGSDWRPQQNALLIYPDAMEQEREMVTHRLEAARSFSRSHPINRITVPSAAAWLGIAAAGHSYYLVRQALRELGLSLRDLERYGIRILKIGMMYPLDGEIVREFAQGLEEILVVEEKRAFLELFLQSALYGVTAAPRIVGKEDEQGKPLIPPYGSLDADALRGILAKRLSQRLPADLTHHWRVAAGEPAPGAISLLARTPYYCSGCPHNRSTVVPDGSLAVAGIGCHTMAHYMDRNTFGLTQMGGEGAHWVGMSPFSEIEHVFQNIGDGTLTHSGTLAIRQAVAAGVNLTFKILYNSAVAMTGGQPADGLLSIPALTRELEAEGVRRILIIQGMGSEFAEDARWSENAELWSRDDFDEAQQVLRETEGVTALIYDQECAANLRRKRRRGIAETPNTRIYINEAVCEGCGDCGRKSNCLSVQPIQTEFGRKTQIHQSSCNLDYSCLDGDCPAFLKVEAGQVEQQPILPFSMDVALPAAPETAAEGCQVVMVGIGGTGVVTTNQILGTAALLAGFHIRSLDQTGLSQKGGPVVSSLKINREEEAGTGKVSAAEADLYLVYDLLAGVAEANLSRAAKDRTTAIVSCSEVPTGHMIADVDSAYPAQALLLKQIEERSRAEENVVLDAVALAEQFFADHMAANMIVLGAAYQSGRLLVDASHIEEAIAHNGVAVAMNQNAFRLGRAAVALPEWVAAEQAKRSPPTPVAAKLTAQEEAILDSVGAERDSELERLLRWRIPELVAYQNAAYARQYADDVRRVQAAEKQTMPGESRLSEAVARYLFKLMAYKDEYEVARLHLKREFKEALQAQFGKGASHQYLLHPPFLRALGMKRKLAFGSWLDVGYRILVSLRRLRGTPLDLFGYARVRRVERTLIQEYRRLIAGALASLDATNYDRALQLADLPDVIRGYEEIKLANVERFWADVRALGFAPAADAQPAPMKTVDSPAGGS